MLMRKTIKNRCEYLNRAGSRPRKYETHVGMYWSVQNKGFFLSRERAKNERRKFCGGNWSWMFMWTYLPFCWFLWLYSHHHPTKISTLCNIGWLNKCSQLFLVFFLAFSENLLAYNERIIRIRFIKSTFITKFKLFIHYRRLLSLDQSYNRLVL